MAKIKYLDLSGFVAEYEARSTDPKVVGRELKKLIRCNKVVKLTLGMHISDLECFYNEIVDEIGLASAIAEDYSKGGAQTGERWMEIRYDEDVPDMAAYRYSKNAQPLHTDESYIDNPCDVMAFYCRNKAKSGGQTNFVDGSLLVDRMRVVDPNLLDLLISTEIHYEKAGNKRKAKIIDLSKKIPVLNFNFYCIWEKESKVNKELNQRFLDFLETHIKGSYIEVPIGLNPGESVFWWDHFVLHGRNPFEATKTNDRFIWKTGVKWNE